MRLALGGGCTPHLPLAAALTAAREAGYDAVELSLPMLWPALEQVGPDGVAALLGRGRLAAVALGPVPDVTFRDPAGLEAVLDQVHGAAALARGLGASWVVVQPGERPDGADERDARREARFTLERLGRAGERYDVGVAVMPLGPPWASLRTVGQVAEAIEAAGRRSLGVAVDTFHFHAGGSTLAELGRCRARTLALVRLADAPAGEREALRDGQRLPPGDGVAPLAAVAATARALRADVPFVLDVPLPPGSADAAGWARRLRERTLGLLAAPEPAGR